MPVRVTERAASATDFRCVAHRPPAPLGVARRATASAMARCWRSSNGPRAAARCRGSPRARPRPGAPRSAGRRRGENVLSAASARRGGRRRPASRTRPRSLRPRRPPARAPSPPCLGRGVDRGLARERGLEAEPRLHHPDRRHLPAQVGSRARRRLAGDERALAHVAPDRALPLQRVERAAKRAAADTERRRSAPARAAGGRRGVAAAARSSRASRASASPVVQPGQHHRNSPLRRRVLHGADRRPTRSGPNLPKTLAARSVRIDPAWPRARQCKQNQEEEQHVPDYVIEPPSPSPCPSPAATPAFPSAGSTASGATMPPTRSRWGTTPTASRRSSSRRTPTTSTRRANFPTRPDLGRAPRGRAGGGAQVGRHEHPARAGARPRLRLCGGARHDAARPAGRGEEARPPVGDRQGVRAFGADRPAAPRRRGRAPVRRARSRSRSTARCGRRATSTR